MYKIRSKFCKTDDMVFISHLDLVRLFERAFRRGDIPIAYTQGFNPHPIMAFATALGIGISSEGEYMDIEVEEEIHLDEFMDTLNKVLPKGLSLVDSKYIGRNESSLMSSIQYSSYIVKMALKESIKQEELKLKVLTFLSLEEIIEVKEKKNKRKYKKPYKQTVQEINIRSYIQNIDIIENDGNLVMLKMLLATGSKGNLKPETVMKKLQELVELQIESQKVRIHRLELFVQITPQYLTPLDIV